MSRAADSDLRACLATSRVQASRLLPACALQAGSCSPPDPQAPRAHTHPPTVTGWIKYTGPAGADALLLAGGQEPDGWATELTGRAALDGAQSRHRMLRRVRLVRGPAVVTAMVHEASPGEWRLSGAQAMRTACRGR